MKKNTTQQKKEEEKKTQGEYKGGALWRIHSGRQLLGLTGHVCGVYVP